MQLFPTVAVADHQVKVVERSKRSQGSGPYNGERVEFEPRQQLQDLSSVVRAFRLFVIHFPQFTSRNAHMANLLPESDWKVGEFVQ